MNQVQRAIIVALLAFLTIAIAHSEGLATNVVRLGENALLTDMVVYSGWGVGNTVYQYSKFDYQAWYTLSGKIGPQLFIDTSGFEPGALSSSVAVAVIDYSYFLYVEYYGAHNPGVGAEVILGGVGIFKSHHTCCGYSKWGRGTAITVVGGGELDDIYGSVSVGGIGEETAYARLTIHSMGIYWIGDYDRPDYYSWIVASPGQLNFQVPMVDGVAVGGKGKIWIANVGEQPLDIDSISLTDETNFHINYNPDLLSTNLGTGESAEIEVFFTPSSTDPVGSTIQIYSNAFNANPKTISLSGQALEPDDFDWAKLKEMIGITNDGDEASFNLWDLGIPDAPFPALSGTVAASNASQDAGHAVSFTVDYGDGANPETNGCGRFNHFYENAGDYQISVYAQDVDGNLLPADRLGMWIEGAQVIPEASPCHLSGMMELLLTPDDIHPDQ